MLLQNKKSNLGFTAIEILVVVAIIAVLSLPIAQLLISAIEQPKTQLASMSSIDQARFVSSAFSNEIRAAAYGSYPLIQAGASEIIFYSTIGATSGVVNRIRYYIQDDVLYKGVIVPSGGVYLPENEILKPVLSGIDNGANSLFYYYGSNYEGDDELNPPLNQPVNINQVRFVKINLTILNKATAQDESFFSISAGSAMRSLKDNYDD
jgi:prepilin-type N-terminal cleavage/methylation domain-containing protein